MGWRGGGREERQELGCHSLTLLQLCNNSLPNFKIIPRSINIVVTTNNSYFNEIDLKSWRIYKEFQGIFIYDDNTMFLYFAKSTHRTSFDYCIYRSNITIRSFDTVSKYRTKCYDIVKTLMCICICTYSVNLFPELEGAGF